MYEAGSVGATKLAQVSSKTIVKVYPLSFVANPLLRVDVTVKAVDVPSSEAFVELIEMVRPETEIQARPDKAGEKVSVSVEPQLPPWVQAGMSQV